MSLSDEHGRKVLHALTDLRLALEQVLPVLRLRLGSNDPVVREIERITSGFGAEGSELQSLLGPEDRGPAEIKQFRRPGKGAHRR